MSRILLCLNYYPPNFIGGAELIAHEQAKALLRMGHEAAVFAGDRRGGERYSLVSDRWDTVHVHRLRLSDDDFRVERLEFRHTEVERRFEEIARDFRPEIVHMHNLAGMSAGLISLARRLGALTVVTLHDYWGFCFRGTLLRPTGESCSDISECAACLDYLEDPDCQRRIAHHRRAYLAAQFRHADAFIAPSLHLARAYARAGFAVGRIYAIANGIDVARFRRVRKRPGDGRVRFTFTGYLVEHKGVANLLDAAAALRERPLEVNVVGSGPAEAMLRERAEALGLSGHVRFWGRVDSGEIERVYERTDVLVLPSLWDENQPVSIAEAMACRIPAIAPRRGGIPETIEDGASGILYDPRDTAGLAGAMTRFLDRPDQIAEFGERAFARIAPETFDRQTARIVRLYERLAARAVASRAASA